MVRVRVDWLAVLDLLWETFEVFSRRDCGWILAGYRSLPGRQNPHRLLFTLEREGLIASTGSGVKQRFRVTAAGVQRLGVTDPMVHWQRPWDQRWRIVSYDLPERQRSVWIWPHKVEELLWELVESAGVPECFIGFESPALFLASNAEVVAAAWDWREIARRQQVYLQHLTINASAAEAAADHLALARLARSEHDLYQSAFSLDPLLPGELLPAGYLGRQVLRQRRQFRRAWQHRWATLPEPGSALD